MLGTETIGENSRQEIKTKNVLNIKVSKNVFRNFFQSQNSEKEVEIEFTDE